ncbi:MAG: hypothetical protein Q4B59_02785 [Lachnospiraceae bacterium]|nr:hypothetical protein [Lachnospiraceae bacterium]
MQWFEKCVMELTHHNVFNSAEQRLRFRDLVSCYSTAPFFNKALAKCMFIACKDDEHFIEMLDDLNVMTIDGEKSLRLLSDRCTESVKNTDSQSEPLYELAISYMNDESYTLPDLTMLDADLSQFIRQALKAAGIIDELPDPRS